MPSDQNPKSLRNCQNIERNFLEQLYAVKLRTSRTVALLMRYLAIPLKRASYVSRLRRVVTNICTRMKASRIENATFDQNGGM